MEDLPIKLELDYGYPKNPSPLAVASAEEEKFPILRYEGPADLDLPQDGTMTVKYHVKRETSEVDRKTGKHHYCCDIEILSIEKVKGESVAPARSGSEAGDALDRLKEELERGAEHEAGEHDMDEDEARETAQDHLDENPTYYTDLKKAGLS